MFPLGQTNLSTEGTSRVRDEKPDSTMEIGASPVLLEFSALTSPRQVGDRARDLRRVSFPTVAPNVGLPAALARGKHVPVQRFQKSLTLLDVRPGLIIIDRSISVLKIAS